MIKIFLMFVSLLNIVKSYDITIEEENKKIYQSSGEYTLLEGGELYYGDDDIYQFVDFADATLVATKEGALVLVTNKGYASLYIFRSNSFLEVKTLTNKYKYIRLAYFNDKVYLFGQIELYQDEKFFVAKKTYFDSDDAFIVLLDEDYSFKQIGIFGGTLKEGFLDMRVNEQGYFLFGKKDPLSGGDFGNTYGDKHSYYLAHLDQNFKLLSFITFREEEFLDYRLFPEGIYVAMKDNIYFLDYSLELAYSLKIPSALRFGYFSYNYSFIGINGLETNICDLQNKKWTSFKLDNDDVLQSVVIDEDSFLLKYQNLVKRLGIYDVTQFKDKIKNGEDQGKISNMFWDLSVQKIDYPEYFNSLVCGEYKANFIYAGFSKEGKVVVEREVNIREGGVYPLGYRLLFTGVAYLDNVIINNNHPLLNRGYHELVLVNNIGEKEKITFYVDRQMEFMEEKNRNFDIEVYPLEPFTLMLTLNCELETKINYVIINKEKVETLAFNYPYLQITLEAQTVGTHTYHLTKLNYNNNQEIGLDYCYRVRVLQNDFSIRGHFQVEDDYLCYKGEVEDPYKMGRFIKFIIKKGEEEQEKSFSLSSQTIYFNNLPAKIDEIIIYFVIDEGGKEYREVKLFSFTVNEETNMRLGSIQIDKLEESLKAFSINIEKKKIQTVMCNDKIVYEKEEADYTVFKICVGIGIISGGIIFFLRSNDKGIFKYPNISFKKKKNNL